MHESPSDPAQQHTQSSPRGPDDHFFLGVGALVEISSTLRPGGVKNVSGRPLKVTATDNSARGDHKMGVGRKWQLPETSPVPIHNDVSSVLTLRLPTHPNRESFKVQNTESLTRRQTLLQLLGLFTVVQDQRVEITRTSDLEFGDGGC